MSAVVEFEETKEGVCSNNNCNGILVTDATGMDRKLRVGMRIHTVRLLDYHIQHVYCERCGLMYHPSRLGFPADVS
jgi:uncharacterized OB-fold protein